VDARESDAFVADAERECNGVTNTAPIVITSQVAEDPPQAIGGSITLGRYHRTASTIYTGPGGATGPIGGGLAETHIYDTNQMHLVTTDDAGTETGVLGYLTNDTMIEFSFVCPDLGSPPFHSYTATATSLVLFGQVGSFNIGVTYELVAGP
jgi:hypothetical protein